MGKRQGKFRGEIMFNKHLKIFKYTSNRKFKFRWDPFSSPTMRSAENGDSTGCRYGETNALMACWPGCELAELLWGQLQVYVYIVSTRTIPFLSTCSTETSPHVHKYARTRMFVAAIHVARKLDIIGTSINRGILRLGYIHTMEYMQV